MGSSSAQSWAYGAYRTANVSGVGHNLTMGFTYGYVLRAYFGVQVILNETNVSSTVHMVELQRTMAANLYAEYCRPTCATAVFTVNISVKALEVAAGFVNVTSAGQVFENGSAVPAIGLLNAFAQVRGSYTETDAGWVRTMAGPLTNTSTISLTASTNAGVSFTPALGLYPSSVSPGANWNSTSGFDASGNFSVAAHWATTNWMGVMHSGGPSSNGSVSATGNVTLQGHDLGPLALADGSTSDQLGLHVNGPFSVREGVLFLPSVADLFDTATDAHLGSPSLASESAATSYVDVNPATVARMGLLSSASTFTSSADGIAPSAGVTPALVPSVVSPQAETTGPVSLQTQPESVPNAVQQTGCLQAGNCPIPGPSSTFKSTGLILVGLVVGLVVASVLVVARRRQTPTPPHPQAALYPPGASTASRPSTGSPPPGARGADPPAEEEDPLSHLW